MNLNDGLCWKALFMYPDVGNTFLHKSPSVQKPDVSTRFLVISTIKYFIAFVLKVSQTDTPSLFCPRPTCSCWNVQFQYFSIFCSHFIFPPTHSATSARKHTQARDRPHNRNCVSLQEGSRVLVHSTFTLLALAVPLASCNLHTADCAPH